MFKRILRVHYKSYSLLSKTNKQKNDQFSEPESDVKIFHIFLIRIK